MTSLLLHKKFQIRLIVRSKLFVHKKAECKVCQAGRGYPRTSSTTTDANLDYAFVKNALFYTPILDYEKPTE